MPQLITRCPHCSTSFHLNQQQLNAAQGAVRCGFCLQVFNAVDYMEFKSAPQSAELDTAKKLPQHDDLLIPDDTTQKPMEATAQDDQQQLKSRLSNQSTPEQISTKQPPQWFFVDQVDTTGPEEELQENKAHTKNQPKPEPANTGLPPAQKVSDSDNQIISAIEPAPLNVRHHPHAKQPIRTWLWLIMALLLLITLLAQTAFFQFDTLNKREPWRQFYAVACTYLGCLLPPRVDLSKLHISKLVVHSHPHITDALLVEAVLLNQAPFPQPFPALQLSFSDLKNNPVASRRFEPQDYLRGELAGHKQMPQHSPVRFAIEIVDPGRSAVNYQLLVAPLTLAP